MREDGVRLKPPAILLTQRNTILACRVYIIGTSVALRPNQQMVKIAI